MFIGNIVTESNFDFGKLFNVTTNMSDTIEGLPTLIVGWGLVKEIFVDQKISILEKNIDIDISWTFTQKERRVDFEKDYDDFIKTCITNLNSTTPYIFINILTCKLSDIKKILEKIRSDEKMYIYIHNNSFIYLNGGENTFGFDLNSVDFLKINRTKLYRLLYSTPNNDVFFNFDFIKKTIKYNIVNQQKLIPKIKRIVDGN
jgi:hypothetical protein